LAKRLVLSLAGVAILAVLAVGIFTSTFRTAETNKNTIIAAAEAAIREQLRDPTSGRFLSAVFKHTKNLKGEPTDVVCGELVAKNGYGGVSPASPFLYIVGSSPQSFLTDPSIASDPDTAELIGTPAYKHLCLGL
jgi:hypothetical protein